MTAPKTSQSSQSIQVPVGETVKVAITLAYKKAEVARLPDAKLYQAIDFMMFCDQGNIQEQGADKAFADGQFMACQSVRAPLSDDQAVEAFFRFPASDPKVGKIFKAGQKWQLFLAYVDSEGNAPFPTQGDPRLVTLGEVGLIDPPAAASGSPSPSGPNPGS